MFRQVQVCKRASLLPCSLIYVPQAVEQLVRAPGHYGHKLLCSNTVLSKQLIIWCAKCGAFSEGRKVVKLISVCKPIAHVKGSYIPKTFGPAALSAFSKLKHPISKVELLPPWNFDECNANPDEQIPVLDPTHEGPDDLSESD